MIRTKQVKPTHMAGKTMGILAAVAFAVMIMLAPATVYADNTAIQNNNFSNPNWQNTHHYDYWNWQHNWA